MRPTFARWWIGVALATLVACGGGGGGGGTPPAGPTLVGTVPSDGTVGVAPGTTVEMVWAQDIDPATIASTVELLAPSGPVSVAYGYDPATRRVRMTPDDPLVLGTRYVGVARPGLATTQGEALTASIAFSFRIRAGVLEPTALLETIGVGHAQHHDVALTGDGRGFVFWTEDPPAGPRNLWATALDAGTGPGSATVLGSATILGLYGGATAVNAAGDAVVAWETQGATDDTWVRNYDAESDTWLPTQQLNVTPGETARAARVALDDAGRALVVWAQEAGFAQPDDLWYRTYTPTGGWGPATLLESLVGDASGAAIGMNAAGMACVAWHQENPTTYNIHARRFDPAGGWSAVEVLEPDDTTRAFHPLVEVAPYGDILVCWRQEVGAPNSDERTWANHFVAGGGPGSGWQGEELLQDDTGENRGMGLAMDADGNAIVVWAQYVNPNHHAYARRHLASGTWEQVVTLSGTDDANIDSWSIQVVMTAAGQALTVWTQGDGLEEKDVRARAYDPASGWGGIETVDPAGLGFTPVPRVVLDPEANALVGWKQSVYDAVGTYLRTDAWSNVRNPGSGWQGAALLESEETESASDPFPALDRLGRGVMVWRQTRGGGTGSDLYYRLFR